MDESGMHLDGDPVEDVILATFADDSHAYEAMAELKQLDASDRLVLREAAVVQRSDTGELTVHDESAGDVGVATVSGGFIGLLVGVLGGPVGILLGGSIGVIAGSLYEADEDQDTDSVLEKIAHNIPNGATALVAAVQERGPQVLDSAINDLGGAVFRYARKDVEAEIAGADRAARKARRRARKELRRSRRDTARARVHAKLEQMHEKLHLDRDKVHN